MKFECKGTSLITVVTSVSKARSKQTSQNYLQDIHIELENHLLTLRATNLEISCEKSVSVKGIQNGKCIVKGDTLVKITQLLQKQDETLVCELIDGVFSIKKESGVIELKTTPYEDFPTLPTQGESLGVISNKILTSIIRDVSFCAATTEIKPEISSVYIYTENETTITAVATDSYRLAEKRSDLHKPLTLSILIPQKHIVDILSILSEELGDISLYKNESIITCISESGLTLCLHTVTGQFPDYKQLFPKAFTTNVLIQKEDLQKALNLTTYFTEDYSQVECIFANNIVTTHSKNESIGQATNTIQSKQEGDDTEAKYNNKFFLESLSHVTGKQIELYFTTPNRPVFIKGTEDATFTYLLMPLTR
jgi:DNA polymerase-3 subunit beta